ncbi:MAG: diacylglycerol kinase family protein [Ferruginibacter sp.]
MALKLLFVINASSGSNDTSWEETISNYFTGKQHEINYFMLEKNMNTTELKKMIGQSRPDKVIAVGGDGTVMLVAKLIAGSSAALGILPAGSANGMAKELNISETPDEALAIIENGTVSSCDAIKLNEDEISLHMADIGINAQLIKYFSEGNLRGKLGYLKVMFKTLWHAQKVNLFIQSRDYNINTRAFMVIIANATKYGTGAIVNPDGKLNDGKFELVIVRKLSLIEIIKTFFNPGSLDPKKIEVIQVSSVNIQAKRSIHFQIDGEYIGKIKKLNAVIIPGYVNVIQGNKK